MKSILKIVLLLLLIVLLTFNINYFQAKKSSIDYLMIMNTFSSDEQYQRVKREISGIVSDYTRVLLFEEEHFTGPYYPYIEYKVNKVRLLEVKGFNSFIFEITFTVKDWGTVVSIVYVENGRVYNTHRK